MRPPWIITRPPKSVVKLVASTVLVKVVSPVLLMATAPSLSMALGEELPKASENNTAPLPEFTVRDSGVPFVWLFTVPVKVTAAFVVFNTVAWLALSSNMFSP